MNTQQRVLVVGGTGIVGAAVARQLQQDGYSVRLLTRNVAVAQSRLGATFEYVEGDTDHPASLEAGLKDCTGVHLSLPSGHKPTELDRVQHQGAARVARLAAQRGIQHLTYTSGCYVSEDFAYIPAERAKLDAEKAIRSSGVRYTIFRPTYFMDFLPRFLQGQRASVFGVQPHPIRFLALTDYAVMVSKAHQQPGTQQALFVCGPEALTFEQALRLYTAQVSPQAKLSHSPFWMMSLINRLFLGGQLTEILQLMAATERVGEIGDPTEAQQRFGPARTTVQMWVSQLTPV
jgi:uncharacterized protein YbjT (DUF2867 family)